MCYVTLRLIAYITDVNKAFLTGEAKYMSTGRGEPTIVVTVL